MPQSPHNQPDWREARRLHAWTLHESGWSQTQIAEALGVTQGAVSRWFKQVREVGDVTALQRRPAPGKQALMTHDQFFQLPDLIARGAEAFGFEGDHWTTKRVAQAIQQVFGVSYHPGHVSKLLQKYSPDWRSKQNP